MMFTRNRNHGKVLFVIKADVMGCDMASKEPIKRLL